MNSPSWIDRFKKRYGLGRIQKAGESGGVDIDVVNEWKDGKLREILENYRPDKIYNAYETGLFWLLLYDDIVQVVRDPSLEGNLGDEDDDDQMELEALAPKLAEAYSALRTLRYYGLGVESTQMENLTHRMESLLMHQSQQAMVQKRITDSMK